MDLTTTVRVYTVTYWHYIKFGIVCCSVIMLLMTEWNLDLFVLHVGRKRNETGQVEEWWTQASVDNFIDRTQCYIEQYSDFNLFGIYVRASHYSVLIMWMPTVNVGANKKQILFTVFLWLIENEINFQNNNRSDHYIFNDLLLPMFPMFTCYLATVYRYKHCGDVPGRTHVTSKYHTAGLFHGWQFHELIEISIRILRIKISRIAFSYFEPHLLGDTVFTNNIFASNNRFSKSVKNFSHEINPLCSKMYCH